MGTLCTPFILLLKCCTLLPYFPPITFLCMLYNIIDEALEGCVGGEGKFLGGGVGPSDRSERRWSPFLLCDGFGAVF